MLLIICLKMALSSQLVMIDLISGASSACLLAKTIVSYVTERQVEPPGFLRKMLRILFWGAFMYFTLMMITIFAIESERRDSRHSEC